MSDEGDQSTGVTHSRSVAPLRPKEGGCLNDHRCSD